MGLSFRLGRVPVRVHATFFLTALFLGLFAGDARELVAWVAIVFVSVMLHELGHAAMGLAFGLEPRIDLYSMGGRTSWSAQRKLSTAQRVAIALAGPFAGFVVAAAVVCVPPLLRASAGVRVIPPGRLGEFIATNLWWVNAGWGVLNLLPVLPLDGGNVLMQLLQALTGGRGERPARIVSIVVAGACVPLSMLTSVGWWGSLLAASLVASNWRGLQEARAREHDAPMRATLEQAYAALERKDAAQVLALARPVALGSKTASVRAEALHLLAFGFLLEGRVADADAAIAAMPRGFSPHASLLELRASTAPRVRP
jgi:stage IV sporulation protein FB